MVFRVKQLNNRTVVQMIYIMKPCNITSRSLFIARLSESKKTTAQILSVQYLVSVCIIPYFLAVAYILVCQP